ncbi:MAG: UDP-glucuronosyltransferase [Desulfuromonadaceae bacterium]|nr:UDP-glucuronosyltransferase [Desulfuromonadaceae bacterium]
MTKILFAWELGGNYGHLGKQLMIARTMKRRGYNCQFAARNVSEASFHLAGDNFEIVQAPFHSTQEGESEVLSSYVDILRLNGFDPPALLQQLVESWHAIFEAVAPEIVVIDYSPMAVLAAKIKGIPVLRLDTGFGCPPDEIPFPSFRPWLDIPVELMLEKELKLLENINQVCRGLGTPPFRSLQDVLATGMDLLTTFPELDSYPRRRFGHYIGPLINISDGTNAVWPDGPELRVFAYLRPFDGLEIVLHELAERSLSVIAVVPGIEPKLAGRYTGDRFQIVENPVRLAGILNKMDLAVTYGSQGLANICMLQGVPTIPIPPMIEQLMTANNLERLGIGVVVLQGQVGAMFAAALEKILSEPFFRERAAMLAKKYAGYDQDKVLENIADTIQGIIRRKRAVSLKYDYGYSLPLSCLPGAPAEMLTCK